MVEHDFTKTTSLSVASKSGSVLYVDKALASECSSRIRKHIEERGIEAVLELPFDTANISNILYYFTEQKLPKMCRLEIKKFLEVYIYLECETEPGENSYFMDIVLDMLSEDFVLERKFRTPNKLLECLNFQ